MNYKVLSHDYWNTGGHCMVSVFALLDEDEQRELFLMINEEGGCLTKVDYIGGDVDYDDAFVVDEFTVSALTPDNPNYELYRYGINEYLKKDCRYMDWIAVLPYDVLRTRAATANCT